MAVVSGTWSARLLDLWRGRRGRDPDRCFRALSYLLIKLIFIPFPHPFYHIQACVRKLQYLIQLNSFSYNTQGLVGGGGGLDFLTSYHLM